jgi:RNA methyltransferase, TrmH family
MLPKSQVKYIQSLCHKKQRDEDGVFIAEGPKLVAELLTSKKVHFRSVYALEQWVEDNELLLQQIDPAIIEIVPPHFLERISALSTPNQVLVVAEKPMYEAAIALKGKFTLALDNIQDPGNMGTIIRTADWFGIETIVCSEDCADVFSPKVVQATMGSLTRVNVVQQDLAAWMEAGLEVPVYATVLNGENIYQMARPVEGVLLIGNESKGIHESLLPYTQHQITIPRIGAAESLNVSVATGIVLAAMVVK